MVAQMQSRLDAMQLAMTPPAPAPPPPPSIIPPAGRVMLGFEGSFYSSGSESVTVSNFNGAIIDLTSRAVGAGSWRFNPSSSSSSTQYGLVDFGDVTEAFTLALWINLDSHNPAGRTYIIDSRYSDALNAALVLDADGKMFFYPGSAIANGVETKVDFIPSFGTWEHLAVVCPGTGSEGCVIYHNGAALPVTLPFGRGRLGGLSGIGNHCWKDACNSVVNYALHGRVDQLFFSAEALSADAVSRLAAVNAVSF